MLLGARSGSLTNVQIATDVVIQPMIQEENGRNISITDFYNTRVQWCVLYCKQQYFSSVTKRILVQDTTNEAKITRFRSIFAAKSDMHDVKEPANDTGTNSCN